MLKALNAKLLAGILAVLIAIAGLLVKNHEDNKRAAEAAEKAAAILAQQQAQQAAERKAAQEQADRVNKLRRAHSAMPEGDGRVWRNYLP